jgi:sugar (pentulose or hexulose) kinase
MASQPVIAVIDVGKTNKKLLLFNEDYKLVNEQTAKLEEIKDEDGEACEDIERLRLFVYDSLRSVFNNKEYEVKAINFCSYGASFVYVDKSGKPLCPLYNYLKPFPEALKNQFYGSFGGEDEFSKLTASPVLGNLNSGMQVYRIKYQKPELFSKIKYALHLPQYLSSIISGDYYSDLTSIGCHTNLWDFHKNAYHEWVYKEGIDKVLAPIRSYNDALPAVFPGSNYLVGVGLHDSSAALIPYLVSFPEPFVLISSGTWCISLNPFNNTPLTSEELAHDCLCYIQYKGEPVKASRLFAGMEHEEGIQRISDYFGVNQNFYRSIQYKQEIISELKNSDSQHSIHNEFKSKDLSQYSSKEHAYHQLILDIITSQVKSTNLVLNGSIVKRIFVDGGFSRNEIYMNLLANAYPHLEVFAASMSQSTALGSALALHSSWNKKEIPSDLVEIQYYGSLQQTLI